MCTCGDAHICLDIPAAFEQPLHHRLLSLHRICQRASGQPPWPRSHGHAIPVIGGRARPLDDSQGAGCLWTDVAANSAEEPFLPPTATGGQAPARPSGHRQRSPEESPPPPPTPKFPRSAFFSHLIPTHPPGFIRSHDFLLT